MYNNRLTPYEKNLLSLITCLSKIISLHLIVLCNHFRTLSLACGYESVYLCII